MHINLKLCISARNYLPDLFTQQVTKGASGEFGQQLGREGLSPLPLPPAPAGGWFGFVIIYVHSGPVPTQPTKHGMKMKGFFKKKILVGKVVGSDLVLQ